MPNNDKLDELLRRHAVAGDIVTPEAPVNVSVDDHHNNQLINKENITPAPVDPPVLKPREFEPYITDPNEVSTEVQTDEIDSSDIDYGDNDAEEEAKVEEEAMRKEREAMYAQAKQEHIPNAFQPPDEKDEQYNREAIGFQSEKLAIVAQMVNRVVAKYHIISGGIPDIRELPDGRVVQKMNIMGELIDIYHNSGETITPEFERMILDNWVLPNGKTAGEELRENGNLDKQETKPVNTTTDDGSVVVSPLQVNVNVQPNTPVTINVDENITANIENIKTIDVFVKEVTTLDMQKSVVVNNSDASGVITVYDAGINDQPVTLPRSAYRCVMSSVNWFDVIKLTSSPTSGNLADNELRKWSIIFKHMKNISIGKFNSFTDFLQKTKYGDRELLMWTLLVATGEPEEDIVIRCGNPDCDKDNSFKYQPAKIIHFDEALLPKYYHAIHDASIGEEAIKLWNEKANTKKLYTLPKTGITVELEDPSVYDYIYTKLPTMNALYKRFRPDDDDKRPLTDDEEVEYRLLLSMMLSISAVIIHKDGIDYRYDKWERIEEVITNSLDNTDSGVLIKLTQVVSEKNDCFSFYLENLVCPHCGKVSTRIPIHDIADTLLSQLSQRLINIDINLTDME